MLGTLFFVFGEEMLSVNDVLDHDDSDASG